MTYVQGGHIQASDFNTFKTGTSSIYNVGGIASGHDATWGYGQTTVIPTVTTGQFLRSAEWTTLRDAIVACAQHQGTTIAMPSDANLAVGQLVYAYPPHGGFNIASAITAIQTNRSVVAPSSLTTFANQLVSTRTTPWNTQVLHDFFLNAVGGSPQASYDNMRAYFNTGGSISMRASLTGSPTPISPQNSFWQTMLARIGTIKFSANSTSNSYKSSPIGYFQLNDTFQLIFTENSATSGGSTYEGSNISIYAQGQGPLVEAPGINTIEFKVIFNDTHTGTSDSVSGTLSSNIDVTRATNPLTIPALSITNVTGLSAGS